jgi:hypothetical protein
MVPTSLCLLVFALVAQAWSVILVDPVTRHFVDEDHRIRIFHGVNAVYKIHPYVLNLPPSLCLNTAPCIVSEVRVTYFL